MRTIDNTNAIHEYLEFTVLILHKPTSGNHTLFIHVERSLIKWPTECQIINI